jgi:hypothetical protein
MQPPDELSVDGRRTDLRPIADFQLTLPPAWAKIPVKPEDSDWTVRVANYLCDDEGLRRRLAVGLKRANRDLLGPDPPVLAAVWVPDRTVGDPQGMLTVDWAGPDPGVRLDLPYYRGLVETTPRAGVEILEQKMDEVTLPAGPALRIRERTVRSSGKLFSRRKDVYECVIYTVFPPECRHSLVLTFATDAVDLGDKMVEQADAMVPSLNVLLGDPHAVT